MVCELCVCMQNYVIDFHAYKMSHILCEPYVETPSDDMLTAQMLWSMGLVVIHLPQGELGIWVAN